MTKTVQLSLDKEDIGRFLGKGGSNLKRHILEKTHKEIEGENNRLFCSIETEGENVTAVLKTQSDEMLEKLEKNVRNHEKVFLANKKKISNRLNTKFVFKTELEHHLIPKFIGTKGRNIKELEDNIRACDNGLDGDRVRINICPDKKIRMKYLHFERLNVESDDQSDNLVLVTVELNSNDREASLSTIRNAVKESIEKTMGGGNYKTTSNEYEFEDDGGGW